MYLFKLIKDWFNFICKPTNNVIRIKFNISLLISFLFYLLFFLFTLFILVKVTEELTQKLASLNIIQLPIVSQDKYPFSFFKAIIFIPLLEELAFRLSLKYKPIFFSLSTGVLLFMIFKICFYGGLGFHGFINISVNFLIIILVSLFTFLTIKGKNDKIEHFYNKRFYFIFYLSALIFAYLHITKYYANGFSFIIYSPIFLFPIIYTGLNLGFIRLKYGFFYCVLMHSFLNLIGHLI